MLKLPAGFIAQIVNRREAGNKSYEFNHVYRPDGFLDPAQSFWVVTSLDSGAPGAREITYAEYRTAQGRDALALDEFGSPHVPVDRIEDWLNKKAPATGRG